MIAYDPATNETRLGPDGILWALEDRVSGLILRPLSWPGIRRILRFAYRR